LNRLGLYRLNRLGHGSNLVPRCKVVLQTEEPKGSKSIVDCNENNPVVDQEVRTVEPVVITADAESAA
jgi:hypothetical protein